MCTTALYNSSSHPLLNKFLFCHWYCVICTTRVIHINVLKRYHSILFVTNFSVNTSWAFLCHWISYTFMNEEYFIIWLYNRSYSQCLTGRHLDYNNVSQLKIHSSLAFTEFLTLHLQRIVPAVVINSLGGAA